MLICLNWLSVAEIFIWMSLSIHGCCIYTRAKFSHFITKFCTCIIVKWCQPSDMGVLMVILSENKYFSVIFTFSTLHLQICISFSEIKSKNCFAIRFHMTCHFPLDSNPGVHFRPLVFLSAESLDPVPWCCRPGFLARTTIWHTTVGALHKILITVNWLTWRRGASDKLILSVVLDFFIMTARRTCRMVVVSSSFLSVSFCVELLSLSKSLLFSLTASPILTHQLLNRHPNICISPDHPLCHDEIFF